MPSHSETKIVPYAPGMMFNIVSDVERYPDFLPWCAGLRVISRKPGEKGEVLTAEMLVGFGGLREGYTSRVTLNESEHRIDISSGDGPFRRMEGHWLFAPDNAGCRVSFAIDFEFKNRLLGALVGRSFGHALIRLSDAFAARAKRLTEESEQ